MFLQKRTFRNLVKLFFLSSSDEVLTGHELKEICDLFVAPPATYALNYGKQRTYSEGRSSFELDKLEYLELADSSNNLLATISQRPHKDQQASLFQLMMLGGTENSFHAEARLMEIVATQRDLRYGYARALRDDFDPSTETKMRTGFLSTEVRMEEPKVWMFPPSEIVVGGIKGLYPLNYWCSQTVRRLAEIGVELPASELKLPGVVAFADSDAESLLELNPRYQEFVRFDGIGS
jgi:hypothetical protein